MEGRWNRWVILSLPLDGHDRPRVIRALPGEMGSMPELLTESFCERCGTRYTFEAAHQRVRLKGVKTLSRGFKNFVMSDDTSLDEAMAAARNETDREVTGHQLDAFHQTFNFCMSCRQYTCPNCWNEAEARCLSCAPHLGHRDSAGLRRWRVHRRRDGCIRRVEAGTPAVAAGEESRRLRPRPQGGSVLVPADLAASEVRRMSARSISSRARRTGL